MKFLDELESKAKAATPGPLDVERRDDDCGYMNHIVHGEKGDYAWCRDELDPRAKENAVFIAAANPQTVLALVEVVRAAERLKSRVYQLPSRSTLEALPVVEAIGDFDAAMAELEASK